MSLMVRIGKWMLTERGLFRLREHHAKTGSAHWLQWDRLIPKLRKPKTETKDHKMNVTTRTGTLILDDEAKPSVDDMNSIISAVVEEHLTDAASDEPSRLEENEGRLFHLCQRLCDESVRFRSDTNAHFLADCKALLNRLTNL